MRAFTVLFHLAPTARGAFSSARSFIACAKPTALPPSPFSYTEQLPAYWVLVPDTKAQSVLSLKWKSRLAVMTHLI